MRRPFIGLLVLVACTLARALEPGQAAPAVSLEALEGHTRTLANYREYGATLVVFLSSRSAASRAAMSSLNELSTADANERLLLVGISANPVETAEELKGYLQRVGCMFPVYRDPQAAAAKSFGATMTPECFLVDKEGALVYHGGVKGAKDAAKAALSGKKPAHHRETPAGDPIAAAGTTDNTSNAYPAISFSSETIFDDIPGAPVHHCSSIAETKAGGLVCIWYGGSYESAEDQQLFIARYDAAARRWTTPEVLIHNPDQPPGNAIIFRGQGDKLWIVWSRMEGSRPTRRGSGWNKCRLLQRTSNDDGVTWSSDVELPGSLGWLPRNPPITVGGVLYLPLSVKKSEGTEGGMLAALNADTETWTPLTYLPRAEQLSVAPRTDGSLVGLMRSMPRVLVSTSPDLGKTWEKPVASKLKCPDSSVCLLRLKSGRMIAAHNDNEGWDRSILTIHQSEDEGRTWGEPRVLEYEARLQDGEYSYPCLLQTSDEKIHITYTCRRFTIKHAVFNEAWLTQVVRPN